MSGINIKSIQRSVSLSKDEQQQLFKRILLEYYIAHRIDYTKEENYKEALEELTSLAFELGASYRPNSLRDKVCYLLKKH